MDPVASIENRLKTVAAMAAGGTVALHVLGYLSLRFRIRALGVEADVPLVSDRYLFDGADLLIYLLIAAASLIFTLSPVIVVGWLVCRLPRARRMTARVGEWIETLPDGALALFGILWAVATLHLVLRTVFYVRHLLHEPFPCDPAWLRQVALGPLGLQSAYLAFLLVLPLPTLWVLSRLWRRTDVVGPVLTVVFLLAVVQIMLVPVHFGVLLSHPMVPGVRIPDDGWGLASLEQATGDDLQVWRIFESDTRIHLLIVGKDGSRHSVELPREDVTLEIVDTARLFHILTDGQTCR